MLSQLSNNINLLMSKARLSSSELARKIGIPATTIKRLRNNEQANPTITTLLPIANYFSISLNELLGDLNTQNQLNPTPIKKIPLINLSECMQISMKQIKPIAAPKIITKINTELNVSVDAFAIQLGASEFENFPANSVLIVDPKLNPASGSYIVTGKKNYLSSTIKKYIVDGDSIYLKSLISEENVTKLTIEDKILGVIVQLKLNL